MVASPRDGKGNHMEVEVELHLVASPSLALAVSKVLAVLAAWTEDRVIEPSELSAWVWA